MRKKLIILASIIASLIAIATISAFAYFALTSEKNITVEKDLNDDLINISSFGDLVNYSKATAYNDHNESSDVSNTTAARRTLRLTTDIVLHNNVEITTDCNIDLNGKKLYLNGYDLAFNHSYYGTFQLYNSDSNVVGHIYPKQITIDESTINEVVDGSFGIISINTPNAIIITNNIGAYNIDNTTLTTGDYIHTYSFNILYAGYYALYSVADALVDYADIRVDKLIPSQITTGTNITYSEPTYNFNSNLFIPLRSNGNAYSFIYRDIDLPFNYLNYKNITIEYESNNENIVSNYGEVTLPSISSNVTLTANVKNGEDIIASSTFTLKVINPGSAAILDAAEEIFYSRIAAHYDDEENIYVFNREILLPSSVGSATLEYTPYKESNTDGSTTLFDGDSKKYLSLGTSNITTYTDYLDDFSPTSESAALGVTISNGVSSKTIYIKMTSANMVVNNEASIAKDIINDWYGGKITLTKTGENSYTTQTLKQFSNIDTTKYLTVTALSYTIVNDTHSLYGITGNILGVKDGKTPEAYVQNVMLSCNFTINEKTVSIQIPIVVSTGESTNVSEFLPYYTYYDELVKYSYNNYISQTFEMPFAYSKTGPIICYDFAVIPSNYSTLEDKTLSINTGVVEAIKVKLYYNKSVQKALTFTEGVSYTTLLDTALAGIDLQDILAYGDAKWIYELDISAVPNVNTSLALIYNYKTNYAQAGWTTFCEGVTDDQKITQFTLAGVLHLGNGLDVADETFYKWIYDNFTILADENNNKLTYTTGDYGRATTNSSTGKYVLVDWLEQNVEIDVTTDSTIASITDFTGLQFLVGTKYLNLTDAITDETVAINLAREISKMRNLETLILKNCTGFTDGKITWSSDSVDNDSISRFVKLKNLKVLNVEGCNIVLFDFMDSMTWLSEVHIAKQVVDSNQYYANIYGNRGIVNLWVFADLTDAGVKVYNTYQGDGEVLFEEQKDVNDYLRLKQGIVYQSKLAYGVDISNLFSSFSTTVSDYHMDKYYRNVVTSGQLNVTQKSITFEAVLNTYYIKATGTFNQNGTYYIEDSDSSNGYTLVDNPIEADFNLYYVAETETLTNCKAFVGIYNFELADNDCYLKVKFYVERYEI